MLKSSCSSRSAGDERRIPLAAVKEARLAFHCNDGIECDGRARHTS